MASSPAALTTPRPGRSAAAPQPEKVINTWSLCFSLCECSRRSCFVSMLPGGGSALRGLHSGGGEKDLWGQCLWARHCWLGVSSLRDCSCVWWKLAVLSLPLLFLSLVLFGLLICWTSKLLRKSTKGLYLFCRTPQLCPHRLHVWGWLWWETQQKGDVLGRWGAVREQLFSAVV